MANNYILNSKSVEEAVACIRLDLQTPESPPAWSPDRLLCTSCWQDLAVSDDELCPSCKSIQGDITKRIKFNTGILLSTDCIDEICAVMPENILFCTLSQRGLLILTPGRCASSILLILDDYSWKSAVVFPARGDMIFGDALAMARFYLDQTPELRIKFFFNHSHMRTLDAGDALGLEMVKKLFLVADELRDVFYKDKLQILKEIFRKGRVNRKYDLSRFYSMCSQRQKELIDTFEMSEIDPARALLLIQMVKYV